MSTFSKLNELLNNSKHKVFVSYYHKDDQYWRNKFENQFGHLFIDKSVAAGEIDSDNSDEYIKALIQRDFVKRLKFGKYFGRRATCPHLLTYFSMAD